MVVVLTEAGQHMFAEHHAHHRALTQALCTQFSPEEQACFARVLERLNEMSLADA